MICGKNIFRQQIFLTHNIEMCIRDRNIAVENSKVSNDYFWKTNKYTDQDVFGRTLDLTALINLSLIHI